jgi:hypothetical protein
MYFIFYFLIVILILLFILVQFFNILSQATDKNYKKYFNLLLFVIVLSTVIGIIINVYSIIKNNNKVGSIGRRGIHGAQGNSGKKGYCNNKCGQKVCYLNVVEYANEVFREITKDKTATIKNKYFLKKLNDICSSNDYFEILTREHEKKPTESKLIDYIKGIVKLWIKFIIEGDSTNFLNEAPGTDTNRGVKFLNTKNRKFDYIDSYEPEVLKELKKYDIWRWGDDTIDIQRKKIIIQSDTLAHPTPDTAPLYIIKTNNYEPVYNAKSKKDIWDVKNCPYNQMGVNLDNPDNLEKCIYINKNTYKKSYHNTWKQTEYLKPQELSIYNAIPYRAENGQIYYPVGSVWRGQNSYDKPKGATNTPESSSMCGDGHGTDKLSKHTNQGPEKETILVSGGDLKEPEKYELLWSSKTKCPECQLVHVQIFRPIAPKGYVALGDVAVPYNATYKSNDANTADKLNDILKIRCIPEKYLRKIKLGNMVWRNNDFYYNKYSNYLNYTSQVAYKTNRQTAVSLWDAGNSNSGEEIRNNYGVEIVEDGGYNLFRASQSNSLKPELDTYVINDKYLLIGGGKAPKSLRFNLDNIANNVEESDTRYNTKAYFGKKPQMAILTNIDTVDDITNYVDSDSNDISPTNIKGNPKKFYLVDDGSKRINKDDILEDGSDATEEDARDKYIIKTFNTEKNDYSACLYYNDNYDDVMVKNKCSINGKYNKWLVKYAGDENTSTNKEKMSLHPKLNSGKKLISYYDQDGQNINKLVDNDTKHNWMYETPTADTLPKK